VILVDTSVWIGHLRTSNPVLVRFLDGGLVVSHPFVIGELALGNIRQREVVLDALQALPRAVVAADEEVLHFITRQALAGRGIGYVDVHLLASARLTAGTLLWTDDTRLHAIAAELAVAFGAPPNAL
jgi:predicted nucleic acid-binding protein